MAGRGRGKGERRETYEGERNNGFESCGHFELHVGEVCFLVFEVGGIVRLRLRSRFQLCFAYRSNPLPSFGIFGFSMCSCIPASVLQSWWCMVIQAA